MAKILFLVFGIILITAFYLIEKLIQQKKFILRRRTMKKIFLTAVALLTMATTQVFGMYGVDSDWIDFLTHGNQFRARLEQLGFTLGNDTIKGTFGFDAPANYFGGIIKTKNGNNNVPTRLDLMPNISAGIGYTSSAISVGVGYSISIADQWRGVDGKAHQQAAHTPVLVLNALDNAFRMAIPIQVFHTTGLATGFSYGTVGQQTAAETNSITAVSLDAQFRYYTGMDILTQIRLYIRYGHLEFETKNASSTQKNKYDSFGFDFRLYFASMVEEVALTPFFKFQYNTAVDKYLGSSSITAVGVARGISDYTTHRGLDRPRFDKNPYTIAILPTLGLGANSDVVSIYVEPSLGLKIEDAGYNNQDIMVGLGWGVYGEVYIRPLQSLEWYFEAELGNTVNSSTSSSSSPDYSYTGRGINLNAATGITWYLPAL